MIIEYVWLQEAKSLSTKENPQSQRMDPSTSLPAATELVGSLESLSLTQEYHHTLADKVEKEVVTSEPVISEEKIQFPADAVPVSSATVKSNLLQTIGPSKVFSCFLNAKWNSSCEQNLPVGGFPKRKSEQITKLQL